MTTLRYGVTCFLLLGASALFGGTVYDFESCDSGPIGVWNGSPPSGCNGWYTPPASVPNTAQGSVLPYSVLQTMGQSLGLGTITADPRGGNQALALSGAGTPALGTVNVDRAQHDFSFSTSTDWSVAYDLSALNLSSTGSSYGTDYIGSFSLLNKNASGPGFIVENAWNNSTPGSTWTSFYFVYSASGALLGDPVNGISPGSAWTDLSQNHWYSESTVFDQKTNRIVMVSITDLTTNVTTTVDPTGWYMAGGANDDYGANAFRFAGLGYTNALLVDNVTLDPTPEPAVFFLTGLGLISLLAFRRR